MGDLDDLINHPATAGGFGSFVALLLARKMTWLQALLSWIAGLGCSLYGTPVLIAWQPWLGPYQLGAAFAVGVLGLQLVAIVYDVVLVLREDPRATLAMVVDILLKRKEIKP